MTRPAKYVFGGFSFTAKKAVEKHARVICSRYPRNMTISAPEDIAFLRELLACNVEAEHKLTHTMSDKELQPFVSLAEARAAYLGDLRERGSSRTWPTSHVFFCDETGNTGPQFYCPDQPIYAEGGWLVPHDRRANLEGAFLEIERSFGFTLKTKGTRLKDSPRGRECLMTALREMNGAAIPFFYLVEKRYFTCAKAVETFFDPKYNLSIDPIETHDPEVRKLRADLLYAAPESIIAEFADAFRQEDAAKIAAVGAAWVQALRSNREHGLAMQLQVSLPEIQGNMHREFTKLRSAGFPKGYDTLNAPSLAQVFQVIERSSPPCDLIHDQCDSMAPIYQHFFDLYRDAQPDVLPKLDGTAEIFGFNRLNSFSFGDSEAHPLLRASDYLVAAAVDLARRAMTGRDISTELHACAQYGLGRMMNQAIGKDAPTQSHQIGEIMASDAWVKKVAQRFQ